MVLILLCLSSLDLKAADTSCGSMMQLVASISTLLLLMPLSRI